MNKIFAYVMASLLVALTAVMIYPAYTYSAENQSDREPVMNSPNNNDDDNSSEPADRRGTSTLRDLFVLDRLGDDGDILGGGTDLGDLFLLDQLFGDGGTIFDSRTGAGSSNLGNLLILDELFGSDGVLEDGTLGSGSSLGELFVLDRLFGGSKGVFR